jgi:hypothetical protein
MLSTSNIPSGGSLDPITLTRDPQDMGGLKSAGKTVTQGREVRSSQLPVFVVEGMSFSSSHADIKGKIEKSCRAILPMCHLVEKGGFLYLLNLTEGERGLTAKGELLWFKDQAYSQAIHILDSFEDPWRKRGCSTALPEGSDVAFSCWAYFPEGEWKKTKGARKNIRPASIMTNPPTLSEENGREYFKTVIGVMTGEDPLQLPRVFRARR